MHTHKSETLSVSGTITRFEEGMRSWYQLKISSANVRVIKKLKSTKIPSRDRKGWLKCTISTVVHSFKNVWSN